jgi:hypothetical protein
LQGSPESSASHGGRENGCKCPVPIGEGSHNNIKNNPVFRGMVRQKDGLLTKGKL